MDLKNFKEYKQHFRVESFGGATNGAAALGNGRLTVGISPWSELIYFRWPTLSYYDHLRYFTKTSGLLGVISIKDNRWGIDAPSLDWRKYGRPFEVYPELGAKGGLFFETGELSWLGDASWTSSRSYIPEGGQILSTQLIREAVEIGVDQWVEWTQDVFIQEFQINAESAKKFFYYATFAPSMTKDRSWGIPDTKKSGFATVYIPNRSIILSFLPKTRDFKRLPDNLQDLKSAEIIDELYPEGGIFIAMGSLTPVSGFQIGADRQGRRTPKEAPLEASENAKKGQLNGNKVVLGPANSGFEWTLLNGENRIIVLIAIADTAVKCMDLARGITRQNFAEKKQKYCEYWRSIAQQIKIATHASGVEQRVGRRAILNLFIGRDAKTGAIVAAPTRQPAYYFDWPRDGAFYDLALDLAGFPHLVDHHLEFYRQTQRRGKLSGNVLLLAGFKFPWYSPRGHWDANLYTDGSRGGLFIIPFEIDETALLVWDIWRHEQFIQDSERSDYHQKFTEPLQMGANALLKFVNKRKKWVKRAFEDDNAVPTATLHGAAAVLTGLAAATDSGQRWGLKKELVAQWEAATIDLRQGILRRIQDSSIFQKLGWRGLRWAFFPAPLFKRYDAPSAKSLLDLLQQEIREKVERKRMVYSYLGEEIYILAITAIHNPGFQPFLKNALNELVNQLPIPGADSYGENTVLIRINEDADLMPQQRTSIPHYWTGVCTYLAIEAFYRPTRFLSQIPPIP
ncbi:MAG: hypothetical protein ACTSRS_11770 [Candidatus Helarchaeota archaeon]